MIKSPPRQNISCSLSHQSIKQTEASYGILKGSRETGDKPEKGHSFKEKQQFALDSLSLSGCCCESIQLLLYDRPKKREDYTEPENQEKNVMYYRHGGISPLTQSQVLSHSTGCLGSKRRTQRAVVCLKRTVGFTVLNECM